MVADIYISLLRSLGQRVRDRRKAADLTRRELAQRAGLSERFLADIETGNANLSLLRFLDVAAALRVDAPTLLAEARAASAARPVVALLGLRGAGKSTVGARLADALQCAFHELDREVERHASLSLTEIFEFHGEGFYRRVEREVLTGLLAASRPLVLATGGGLVTESETFELLRARARTIWLKATPKDHWERVVAQGDHRPMANNAQAYQDLVAILAQRERSYEQADLTVDTSGRTVDAVVDEILRSPLVEGLATPGAAP